MEVHNICPSGIVGEVLRGRDNYANWKACITNYLWVRDLWDVVDKCPKHPENADTFWWKKNCSALHAIQISCAPAMLPYIISVNTAKDAWDTLAQKCQTPPIRSAPTEPVRNVVQRTHTLAFLKSINKSDLKNAEDHLSRIPQLINAEIYGSTGRHPLHFAITIGNLEMVDLLLSHMSEGDMEMQDTMGRTALHYVVMSSENTKIAESLIRKNKGLLNIPNKYGYIPLSFACMAGQKDMTRYLYKRTTPEYLLSPENLGHAALVVRWCVRSNICDVAFDLLKERRELADDIYNDVKGTAVIELSCQPSAFLSCSGLSFWQRKIYSCLNVRIDTDKQQDQKETKNLTMQGQRKLVELWSDLLKFFGIKQIYDLKLNHVYARKLLRLMSEMIANFNDEQIRQSSVDEAIFNASQRGMTDFIKEIIRSNPDLLTVLDNEGRNIFHIAVAYRQEKVFSLIYGHEAMKFDFPIFADNDKNNMLHMAGQAEAESRLKLDKISGAALQMQRELQWFKEVEKIVPPTFKGDKNVQGKTPYEIFDQSHAKLFEKGEQWIRDIAQSSTIVGSLIITIMFASLFTVPGGNNQETGIPLLLTKKLIKVFIISDAISLFASSTSVLIFVGILTSRYSRDDFLTSLPNKLIFGLLALFISIATMMAAFCSAVFIMLKGQLEIFIPIVLLATVPICVFVWLQFPLLVTVTMSTYGPGIFDRKMKKWL